MVTLVFVNQSPGRAAAASRDSHLTLRRVERQQYLIERLHASRTRLTHGRLAMARDIERLIHSGVPIIAVPGRGGGVAIENDAPVGPIELDLPEIAALMASLAAVGPAVSASAASAMNKLATALSPAVLSPSA